MYVFPIKAVVTPELAHLKKDCGVCVPPALVVDQPLYNLVRKMQYTFHGIFVVNKYVVIIRGLRIEMDGYSGPTTLSPCQKNAVYLRWYFCCEQT